VRASPSIEVSRQLLHNFFLGIDQTQKDKAARAHLGKFSKVATCVKLLALALAEFGSVQSSAEERDTEPVGTDLVQSVSESVNELVRIVSFKFCLVIGER
jgi:hypothetical protein